jgi:hypothetical protein
MEVEIEMNRNCYTELCATLALGGLVRIFCHTRRDIGDKKAGRGGLFGSKWWGSGCPFHRVWHMEKGPTKVLRSTTYMLLAVSQKSTYVKV